MLFSPQLVKVLNDRTDGAGPLLDLDDSLRPEQGCFKRHCIWMLRNRERLQSAVLCQQLQPVPAQLVHHFMPLKPSLCSGACAYRQGTSCGPFNILLREHCSCQVSPCSAEVLCKGVITAQLFHGLQHGCAPIIPGDGLCNAPIQSAKLVVDYIEGDAILKAARVSPISSTLCRSRSMWCQNSTASSSRRLGNTTADPHSSRYLSRAE